MNKWTEGDARKKLHAEGCKDKICAMYCRCWCHEIYTHQNGEKRADAGAAKKLNHRKTSRNSLSNP